MSQRLPSPSSPSRPLLPMPAKARGRFSLSVESLEARKLLSAALTVTSTSADNRGKIDVTFSVAPLASSLTKKNVLVYTAGKDKKFGTADDKLVNETLTVSGKGKILTILAPVKANTAYLVKLSGAKIKTAAGVKLDGTFHGTFPTGTGKPGHAFSFVARAAAGDPTARFISAEGSFDVLLDKSVVANTVNNFLHYANAGLYDNTFLHRKTDVATEGIAVIQGGGYYNAVGTGGNPAAVPTIAPIALETPLPNDKYTIAMARSSAADSATSEWFVNTATNTALNSTGTGTGYAVFGTVIGKKSRATIDLFASYKTQNLQPSNSSTALGTVPIDPGPPAKLVVFSRVAILDTITAV